ncbi:MAG: ribosome biogenesis GTPase Der [Treponema sp.]|jgi:GTP-binding protein|nr:ribosome biogenesis GTPase Der [Treponema sp.]
MNPAPKLPLVVIAGRPNTGKSTLFNRFLHRRRAITDPTPGVTRDPIEETASINGREIRLMDTGGFKIARSSAGRDPASAEAQMDALVVEKTLVSLKKADLILLLLDAEQLTAEDEEFIALLRPYWNKVIAAVNKTEGGRLEQTAWNYMRFGFESMICVSAEHGDHFPELCERIAERLKLTEPEGGLEDEAEGENPEESAEEREEGPALIRVAVLGKPNTGKSTLTNRLTGTERSIVSDFAGTTRDVVEGFFAYKGRNFQILDTAGIRRKAKVTENVEYYSVNRAIKTLDDTDIVFLLMDAQDGLSEQDKKIAALAHDRGRGIIFVLNKWDIQEGDKKAFKKTEENIRIMFGHMEFAPVLPLSAKIGKGIAALLSTAMELYGQLTRKIDTAALNLALADWTAAYPPPSTNGARGKLRYLVQTGVNPARFLVFASRPKLIPASYLAYLRNKIRSGLGFDKIPVQLEIRESRKKWEEIH